RIGEDTHPLAGREGLAARFLHDREGSARVGANGDLQRRPVAERLLGVAADDAAGDRAEHRADHRPPALADVRAGDATDDRAGARADTGRLVALEADLADRLHDAGLNLHR